MLESLTLGTLIKRLRAVAGMNQREFAEKLEIDPSYLSHLEADRKEPSVQLLRRIAGECSVPPGLLIALAMWTELPAEQRESYRDLLDRLVELAAVSQLKLQLK